jgi:hypothetical protein
MNKRTKMSKTEREQLLKRRELLLRYKSRGLTATETCKAVADELNIEYETVLKDWVRRVRWIDRLLKMQDPTLFQEITHNFTQIRRAAWMEYAKGDNTAAKVGALRVVEQATKDEIEVMQSIGAVARLPVETTLTIAQTPFDADPEIRKLLAASAAKQKAEKDAPQ